MNDSWSVVYSGPIANATLARARLEAAGIPCLIPAEAMKTLSPFDTGGMIFDFEVQVPRSALAAARKILEDESDESEIRPGEEELPAEFFEAEPVPAPESEATQACKEHSRRIRFGAASVISAPFALMELFPYLRAVRRLERKPPQYFATLAGAVIAVLLLVILVCVILSARS